MKRLVAALALLLALTGCAGQNTLDGTITGKDVHAGYFYTFFMPIGHSSCSGSPPICTTYYTYVPILYWVPACYEVAVEGDTEAATGTACIDETEWNGIEVGDHYTGPDVDPRDRKQERSRG